MAGGSSGRRVTAASLAVLATAVLVASGALLGLAAGPGEVVAALVVDVVALPAVVLGLVVAARLRTGAVGPLLVLAGLTALLNGTSDQYVAIAARDPALVPAPGLLVPTCQGLWVWWFVPIALLALVFPDGRFTGPRRTGLGGGLLLTAVLVSVFSTVEPGPYLPPVDRVGHPTWPVAVVAVAELVLLPALLALLAASATALVRRGRRATDPTLRAQVRWLGLAALWLPFTLILCWLSFATIGGADLAVIGLAGLYLSVPAATAVALLRHDLYDVDRAFATAVTWSALAAILLAVYSVAAVVGGLLIGQGSAPGAAAATAVCALVLAPLRTRMQRQVDRRVYPVRRAALAAVEDLRDRARDGLERPEHLEVRLRAALRDPDLRVGYRPPGVPGLVDADGRPLAARAERLVPVVLGGREIGALVAGENTARELLRELATAVALLVEVVCLRRELGAALEEAESSRARLLQVGYEERRRLERDLHDGAQQRLVSVGLSLRLAQRRLARGGPSPNHVGNDVDLDGVLDAAVAELGTAVAELRQIAQGLRPGCLDDGLVPALASLASGSPLPVDLDVDGAPAGAIADTTAVTAYYVVSEAVANAVKHATASRLTVALTDHDGRLHLRVTDDGRGGAGVTAGGGLGGLADRVAAAGGALRVHSAAGRGTEVAVELPCGS